MPEPINIYIEVPELVDPSFAHAGYRAGDYRPVFRESILVGFEVFYYPQGE